MGSKDGYHHFKIRELETVFYEHVKIPDQEYKIENEIPYTDDETKWREIILKPAIHLEEFSN